MKRRALLCLLTIAALPLPGQDADTIILKDDERKFTILSQIEDRAEAGAFLAILKAADAARRFELANNFLNAYPQSWLLAQASDLAARSAIDLGQYDRALGAGRLSLRIVPENPSLLILLANIEAQKELADKAKADASDALEYLDEIERPPNMSQKEWNALKPQLKASAYFARARAEASRSGGNSLQNAYEDLNRAAAWNSDDAEVFFLRAIVQLRLQKKEGAAADLAYVLNNASTLHDKAERILLVLTKPQPLDTFLRTLPPRLINASLRKDPETPAYSARAGGEVTPAPMRVETVTPENMQLGKRQEWRRC